MTTRSFSLGLGTWLMAASLLHADDKPAAAKNPVGAKEVRQTVARSLSFLEKEGLAWWKQRKCNGCHHGAFFLWSHREAAGRGIDVDRAKLEAWTKQALDFYRADLKDHLAKKNGGVEGAHLLLGVAGTLVRDKGPAPSTKDLAESLVNCQQADGFWKYEGQGLKRPDPENNETTTLWAILALAPSQKSDPAFAKSRERALAWLNKAPVGPSNEALVARLLIEQRFGDVARAKALAEQLKGQQHADGGWSWTNERSSEAFATGQSLYALASLDKDEAAIRRAWAFLAAKQQPDGSWASPTRKPPPAKDNPIAVYWGTAWATIGLARTLAEARNDSPKVK